MNNEILSAPSSEQDASSLLTLEAIYSEKIFDAKRFRQPQWHKDGRQFSYLDTLPDSEVVTVWLYNVESARHTPLITLDLLQPNGESGETIVVSGACWSPDETRLLLARVPRPHEEGDKALYVYTLATQTLDCVAQGEQEFRNVKWSPDGTRLGYVRADDLYLLDLATHTETRLTDTAAATIYNGRFGWVYQEELDMVDGWDWSSDGRWIAYCQCDETLVPTVPLTRYEDLHLAPEIQRYPKAGDPNPIVKVGIIDLAKAEEEDGRRKMEKEPLRAPTGAPEGHNLQSPISNHQSTISYTHWLDLDADGYIAGIQWTPDNFLLVQRIPRLQNRLELLRVNPSTGETTLILTETDTAWVDAPGELKFVGELGQFLWPSDRSGYKHLYLYARDGSLVRQLSAGEWEVTELLCVDAAQQIIYFSAASPEPHVRQLFRVSLNGGPITRLSEEPGMHQAVFAPNGKTFLHTHSTRTMPPRTTLRRADGQTLTTLIDNILPKARPHLVNEWEFTTFPADDGVTLRAALLKPADFDPTHQYPVLMYTYGGPGSQVVQNSYGSRVGLEQFLAQQGIVLALVDGRGSGLRGREFKKITYRNLGRYEVEDQIAGAKWLGGLPYVDKERIGIWGWSYGGYMTCLCLLWGADVFKMGAAVAPVTDWKLYDSIYTERYMRRPDDNPDGYEHSAPLTHADKLKGKFLLVHGLDDDNVHFQNAAQLATAWQKQNKPFQMMVYPGKHHGLEGVTQHWAQLFTDFVLANL